MIVFKIILIYLFVSICQGRSPDIVYCVNEECSGPISKAKTLLNYNSADPDLISFHKNADAVVYMKSAGTNADLWYADINGKTGLVNSNFLREYKIIDKNPKFTVPFQAKKHQDVQPDKVQQAHEVFEGTTIFTTETSSPASHDTSTIAPNTEHFDTSTPSLGEIEEDLANKVIENDLQNFPNDISKNESLQDQNNETPVPAISEEPQTISQEDSILDMEAVISTLPSSIPENSKETNDKSASDEQSLNIPQINPIQVENPESLSLPTPIISTSSENFVHSENIVELPKTVDFWQQNIQNPEELNTSVPSNSVNNEETNVQPQLEALSETNVHNQEFYSPPISNNENIQIPPVPEPSATSHNENNLLNNFQNQDSNTQLLNGIPMNNPKATPPVLETIPAAFIDTQTVSSTTEDVPVANAETVPASTEANYFSASTETLSINSIENIPASTESSETSSFPMSTETYPTNNVESIMVSTDTPEASSFPTSTEASPSNAVESTTDATETPEEYVISHENEEQKSSTIEAEIEEAIKESTPYESTESQSATETYFTSTESSIDDIHSSTEASPEQDSNGDSFLSNMYTTLADLWPSSAEVPPQETIFNPEYMHVDEPKDSTIDKNFSFMAFIIATYKSVMGSREESRALFATPGETCYTDEYCDGESIENKHRLLTFLVTTATSILLFTLGYYYIDNKRQDSRLIGTINGLQRDLMFTSKECEILKEELTNTKSKLAGIEDSSFGMDDMVQSLKEEINELKAQNERLRNSLDDNEKLLRVSENTASELQNTMSEVENTLSELLAERANTEEQIAVLNDKVEAFEDELISVSRERDNFQLKYVSAESALEETKKQKKQLEELNQKLSEANNTIELQKHEIIALKEVIKELKSGVPSDVDVNSLIDHTEIKAKLSKATKEKETYMSKYELEHKERVRLAEELAVTQESLQTTSQQSAEALTRLEVLGKYFQQREGELMKELSTKESLWLSKQGESASTVEKMELLQQEAQRYKEKCDELTLELAEQESTRRTAISEIEGRAHTAWLEARQAKRDADAAREEAAALRRKLASLHQADGAASPHRPVASPLEAEESMLAPPMLPLSFMPPPILPPLPRPPPLGRLPSPHPPRYSERRYSSDSRYSPESQYSPGVPEYRALSNYSPVSRFSPEPRYSPQPVPARYAPHPPHSPRRERYSPRARRPRSRSRSRTRSRERYSEGRGSRARPPTDSEYNSGSPSRRPRRRSRYIRPNSGPSSVSTCSSESEK